MIGCEQICDDCPFRRDSTPLSERSEWPEPAAYLSRHGWPNFEPPECIVEGATCLGWAVYVANGRAACMVPSTHQDWVDSWSPDDELIFDGNGEFTRYHRGEWHGSEDYFEDRKSRIGEPSQSYEFDDKGQGNLL